MVGQAGKIIRVFAQDLRDNHHVPIVGGKQVPDMGGFDPTPPMSGDEGGDGQVDALEMTSKSRAVFGIGEPPQRRQPQTWGIGRSR